MNATTPILIGSVLLLALASMVVVLGAVLLAIPLGVALVLVAPAARGTAANRGGIWVEDQQPNAAIRDPLTPPNTSDREAATASRRRTQE